MFKLSTAAAAGAFWLSTFTLAAYAQDPACGLPEGPGRELVEATCTACHQPNQILRSSGYSLDGWKELTGTMIDLSGSSEEQRTITEYLAAHFPPNDKRAPALIPGEWRISFTESDPWSAVPRSGPGGRRLHLGRAAGQSDRADRPPRPAR